MEQKEQERILLVENNEITSDQISRQMLEPLGYQVDIAMDVNTAIKLTTRLVPQLVIVDLDLPGLSGKDLLVALTSQGIQVPVIVMAEKGEEAKVIQAFRLGASDYLLWPAREAEVVAVVERALKTVRERRERELVIARLEETNQELFQRSREMSVIAGIGRGVLSMTDQQKLLDMIVREMVDITAADYGWILLRDERNRAFMLASFINLPDSWSRLMGKPVDDGISSLVGISGETLAIHGEPLKKFNLSGLGRSVMLVPLKASHEVIGQLAVIRKANLPFDQNQQMLLETIAEFTSMSIINSRLLQALEKKSKENLSREMFTSDRHQVMRRDLRSLIQSSTYPVDLILAGKLGRTSQEQNEALKSIQSALRTALDLLVADQTRDNEITENKKN